MEKIIGREKEIDLLKSMIASPRSEFLSLYGRRRVEKTFLVNQVFSNITPHPAPNAPTGRRHDDRRT